jgi:transcriptional regulator with XRE-family HTH domain
MTKRSPYPSGMAKPIRKTPSRALSVLSDNLKALANKNQWTQAELGKETGIGQKQASRILNKETEPRLHTLSEIAEALHKDEALLLCPEMKADHLFAKSMVREELHTLILELIRLDAEHKLTDQTIDFLRAAIGVATQGKPSSPANVKKTAQ